MQIGKRTENREQQSKVTKQKMETFAEIVRYGSGSRFDPMLQERWVDLGRCAKTRRGNGWLYSSPTSVTRSRFGCQFRWVHFFGPPRFGPLMTFFGLFFAKFGFYSPKLL
jgi:hypothetical protein